MCFYCVLGKGADLNILGDLDHSSVITGLNHGNEWMLNAGCLMADV